MKVLMLGWELPPNNSGGLGVACYQLCKALSAKSIDIEFVLPYTAEHNIEFMTITAAHPQNVKSVFRSGIAYDSHAYIMEDGSIENLGMHEQQNIYELAVEQIASASEFDVIHAHDWLTFRAGIRAKQKTNKPLILHVHSVERDRAGGNPGNPMVREIESVAMMLADKVIAVSELTKKAIVKDYGIPENKIDVVHNSIDISMVEPLGDDTSYQYLKLMKSLGYRVVSNVGRLTIQKGLTNLLFAAKEVITREPKTIFLIVGTGEQDYELLELAAELGISKNVVFAGFQRGKRWRDSFAIADLFVMPSISEPFGLTPLEAAGYGTPSLISKQSGVSEVLQNCLKVDFWDIDEMANQITSVVRNDGLRDQLHENAYQEYRRLSWDNAASKFSTIYKNHAVEVVA